MAISPRPGASQYGTTFRTHRNASCCCGTIHIEDNEIVSADPTDVTAGIDVIEECRIITTEMRTHLGATSGDRPFRAFSKANEPISGQLLDSDRLSTATAP